MKYPVYIDGQRCGEALRESAGLVTVFTVRVEKRLEHPLRLYLYSEEKSILLGTLSPDGDGMSLRRSFSRAELKNVPENARYAADKRLVKTEESTDKLWRRTARGCLVSGNELAIPAAPARLARVKNRLRRIEGRIYLIFEIKS